MAGQGLAQGIEDYSNVAVSSLPPGWSQTGQIGYQSCVHNNIGNLVKALTKAQSEFSALLKDTENPYFKAKYADLAGVIKATQPALINNGLVIFQFPEVNVEQKTVVLRSKLAHISGEFVETTITIPTGAKFDAQSIGSAITYARRYAYQALVGVAAEVDDDGNSLTQGLPPAETSKPKYEPKPGKSKYEPITSPPPPSFLMKNSKTAEWQPVTKDEFITGKSPESGQVPKAALPPAPKINVNTNAGFANAADHEPTKEEKDAFKKKARLYVQELLPAAGVENPAETLKAFVEKLTGQTDTKKLSFNQWCATLEALDNAVIVGNLKAVVEG